MTSNCKRLKHDIYYTRRKAASDVSLVELQILDTYFVRLFLQQSNRKKNGIKNQFLGCLSSESDRYM
jgi:hypothetical protein